MMHCLQGRNKAYLSFWGLLFQPYLSDPYGPLCFRPCATLLGQHLEKIYGFAHRGKEESVKSTERGICFFLEQTLQQIKGWPSLECSFPPDLKIPSSNHLKVLISCQYQKFCQHTDPLKNASTTEIAFTRQSGLISNFEKMGTFMTWNKQGIIQSTDSN